MLSQIIRKYKKDIRSSTIIIIADTIVVGLNVIVFRQIEIALYSAIAIYIMGKAIDILLEGIYFSKMVYIISDKYQVIAEKIVADVQRGTTGLYAKGMYTNKEKMLLMCVVRKKRSNSYSQSCKCTRPNRIYNNIECKRGFWKRI